MRRCELIRRIMFARPGSGGSSPAASPPPAGTAPTITSSATFSAAENQTTIGTIVATGTGTMVYSIIGGADQALFDIDSSTGALTFSDAPDFDDPGDDDTDNDYEVEVQADNGVSPADTMALTVSVTDVADIVPIVTASQSFSVAENAADNAVVGTVLVTAGDSAVDAFEFTGGNTGTAFAISSAGVITKIEDLDEGTLSSYTLATRAHSAAGWSASANVGVTVTEAVDWPVSASITPYQTLSSSSMSVPALRTPVVSAKVASTNITRISDPSEMYPVSGSFVNFGPVYANRQHWNSDDSKFIVAAYNTGEDGNYASPYDSTYHLFNSSTYAHLGVLKDGSSRDLPNHWRWSNTDPDEIICVSSTPGTLLEKMTVSTLTFSTIKDFSAHGYDLISPDFCGGVGDASGDGRYWAIGARKSGGQWYVSCWDRQTDTILCEIPVPTQPGPSNIAQANMSQTGAYLTIWSLADWTSGATNVGRGVSVWNKSGALQRVLNDYLFGGAQDIVGGHNSTGVDSAGNDVVVYQSSTSGSDRFFVSRRLDTDQTGSGIQQCPDGMIFGNYYLTPFAFNRDGFVIVSDFPATTGNAATWNGYPLRNHIWAFKLDGTQAVYSICEALFSQTDFTLAYLYMQFPWATSNRAGTKVLFKSSFDTDWGAGSGGVPTTFHAYIASPS